MFTKKIRTIDALMDPQKLIFVPIPLTVGQHLLSSEISSWKYQWHYEGCGAQL